MPARASLERRRRIVRTGAVLATVVLAYIGIVSWLASSRLGRIMDGTRKKDDAGDFEISLDPFDTDFRGDPGQAFGYPFNEVLIPTTLGDAPAWFVPGHGDVWAIFVHGIGNVREYAYRHLSVLQPAGIPTLTITYRNDRGAPRDPTNRYAFGLTEWRDLEAAVDYALAHGARRTILDGESMGGSIVGQFLKRSSRVDHVTAIVLDSPALDMPQIGRYSLRRARAPLSTVVSSVGLWLTGRRFGHPIGSVRGVDAVANFSGPLFIAHGENDSVVPIATSEAVVGRRLGATTFLRTEAGHIMSWQEEPSRYRASLHGFLMSVLHDDQRPGQADSPALVSATLHEEATR